MDFKRVYQGKGLSRKRTVVALAVAAALVTGIACTGSASASPVIYSGWTYKNPNNKQDPQNSYGCSGSLPLLTPNTANNSGLPASLVTSCIKFAQDILAEDVNAELSGEKVHVTGTYDKATGDAVVRYKQDMKINSRSNMVGFYVWAYLVCDVSASKAVSGCPDGLKLDPNHSAPRSFTKNTKLTAGKANTGIPVSKSNGDGETAD